MRVPSRPPVDDHPHLEPESSALLPVCCALAIVVALVVVDLRLDPRFALITAAVAVVSLLTRLPRVVPVTTLLCLALVGLCVLHSPASPTVARPIRTSAAPPAIAPMSTARRQSFLTLNARSAATSCSCPSLQPTFAGPRCEQQLLLPAVPDPP